MDYHGAVTVQKEEFRIGKDIIIRDPPGGRVFQIRCQEHITKQYTRIVVEAMSTIAEDIGTQLIFVLDFQNGVLPPPAGAFVLCKELKQRGIAERIVLVRKEWMTPHLLKAALFIINRSGIPCDVVAESGLQAHLLTLNDAPPLNVLTTTQTTPLQTRTSLKARQMITRLLQLVRGR